MRQVRRSLRAPLCAYRFEPLKPAWVAQHPVSPDMLPNQNGDQEEVFGEAMLGGVRACTGKRAAQQEQLQTCQRREEEKFIAKKGE